MIRVRQVVVNRLRHGDEMDVQSCRVRRYVEAVRGVRRIVAADWAHVPDVQSLEHVEGAGNIAVRRLVARAAERCGGRVPHVGQRCGGLAPQINEVAIQQPANPRPRPDDLPDRVLRHPLAHDADHAGIDHRRHPTGLKNEEIAHKT